jgi:hypothetical protein
MRRALALILPLFVAACGVQEAREPSSATLSSFEAAPVPKSSPRAVHDERLGDASLEASAGGDACSAYADCVDEGSRSFGGEGAMHASSATIRSWTKTEDQLRECATAHSLARAGGLCR